MLKYLPIWLVVCVLMPVGVVFAQEEYDYIYDYNGYITGGETLEILEPQISAGKRRDFWIGGGGDIAMYAQEGYAYGGSFTLGYGRGSAIGLKISMYSNDEEVDTLELSFLLRFFLLKSAYKGPFIQLMTGASLYNRSGDLSIPSSTGMVNAGLSLGWRFDFFERLFLEPSVRGGYPFLSGATICVGLRL
jgi:hypothetical protein